MSHLPPGYPAPPPVPADPRLLPPVLQPTLPVEPMDYVRFLRAPRHRWWKPLIALGLAGVAWGVVTVALSFVGIGLDGFENVLTPEGGIRVGPWTFLANNLALASAIPIVMAVSWMVLGQRPRWLSSVAGGFRWSWFARTCLVILPVWAALIAFSFWLSPVPDLGWRETSVFMILTILLTTPLQAAGEEYLVRGFLARCVGSWFADPRVAFGVSAVVGAAVFTALHVAADPWLNVYYAVFGLVAAWLVWRTGGLEAAIAIHIVNNMLSLVVVPFSDFSEIFDRQVGAGDPTVLINIVVLVGVAVVIDWMARRRGLVTASAPGRPDLERAWFALGARATW